MYVPSLNAFLKNINISADELNSSENVTVPSGLFQFMLQLLIAGGSFNEEGYLRANPDVAEAVKNRQITSARLHYVGYGFFEGRQGAMPEVDEAWYRTTYADVDKAIRNGQIKSAAEHFAMIGAAEGRSPNSATEKDAQQWKKAFGRAA
jgi:hypothetical protein